MPSANLIWCDYTLCKKRSYLIQAWILPVDTISLQKHRVNNRAPFVAWLSVCAALVTGIIHRFLSSLSLVSATEVLSSLLRQGIIFLPKECVYQIFFFAVTLGSSLRILHLESSSAFKKHNLNSTGICQIYLNSNWGQTPVQSTSERR